MAVNTRPGVARVLTSRVVISRKYSRTLVGDEWFEAYAEPPEEIDIMSSTAEAVENLPEGNDEFAKRVAIRTNGHMRYGNGEWDKIPYAVEVETSVRICTVAEDPAGVDEKLFQFALGQSLQHLADGVAATADIIRDDLYPELFPEPLSDYSKE